MNKKLLLAFVFAVSGIAMANAQCTPSGTCLSGICPDTITNLPVAHVSVLYNTDMTVVVPKDTFSFTIDSLNFTSITGLPTGFTATPNKSGWPGNSSGCLEISGTPADSMQGKTYQLIINATVHVSILSEPLTYKGYKIFVNDTTLGIKGINAPGGISFVNNSSDIKIHSANFINDASVIVNDIAGRELMRLNNLNGNDFIINKGNLSNGIYIISVISTQRVIARGKVIIG